MTRRITLSAAILCLFPLASSADALSLYNMNHDTLGGNRSSAWSINDSGQAVGWAQRAAGQQRAALFSNGRVTDLSNIAAEQGRRTNLSPRSINNAGQIVGSGHINTQTPTFIMTPNYQGLVTTDQTYLTDFITLGDTFSFDYFWEMGTEPTTGNFDVLFFNGTGWGTLGWQLNLGGSSIDWASASSYVPSWARGDNVQIKFSLFDWGQETDPTVYLRNIASTSAPVPEPTAALLFGTGLIGLAAFGRRRRK